MRVLRSLLKYWRELWHSNAGRSSEVNARKWAEKIENLNRELYKNH